MGNGAARSRAALPRARGACARRGGAGRRRPGARTPGGWPRRRQRACLVRSFAGPPSSQAAQQNRCLDLVTRNFIRLEVSSILVPIKKVQKLHTKRGIRRLNFPDSGPNSFSASAPVRPASQSLSKAEVLGDTGPPLPLLPPCKPSFSRPTPFSLKPLPIVAHHTEGPLT